MTSERNAQPQPIHSISDDEKIRRAAAVAVHQQYGYDLPATQEQALIEQIAQTLNNDNTMRAHIIASMNEILNREF